MSSAAPASSRAASQAAPNPATPAGPSASASRAAAPASASASPSVAAAAASSAAPAPAATATTAAAASSAAASPRPATPAAASSSAAAPAAQGSESAGPAASSGRASSSAAPASSAPSASSIAPSSSLSAMASSASSRSSQPSASASIAGQADAVGQTANKGLSSGAIGGIAGGAAGAVLLLILAFSFWRRTKGRRDRTPPPPPREMSYSTGTARGRAVSGAMLGTGPRDSMTRGSSYNGLLASQSPTIGSRQPSYYATYPIATPSTGSGPAVGDSPPLVPSDESGVPTNGSITPMYTQPLVAARTSPTQSAFVEDPSRYLPAPIPLGPQAKRIPSIDRLRTGSHPQSRSSSPVDNLPTAPQPPYAYASGSGSVPGGSTPPSPTRTSSPHPSTAYSPRSSHSASFSNPPRFPRPDSMLSLSGRSYMHVGPARGAPHQGRPVQLEMPRLLGTPASNLPDPGMVRRPASVGDMDQMLRTGVYPGAQPVERHQRIPSGQSMVGSVASYQSARSRNSIGPGQMQGMGGLGQGQGQRPGAPRRANSGTSDSWVQTKHYAPADGDAERGA